MKKILTAVLALMLVAVLAVTALAETMYVKTDSAKVYKKKSKKSDVISRLPAGGSVEVVDQDGDWMRIHYINKKGVEKKGWIRAKDIKGGTSGGSSSSGSSGDSSHKHAWTDWRVTREATCTKEGRKEHTCTICGVTKEKEIEKAKHDWGKWSTTKKATCEKAGEKVRKCKVCGKKDKEKTEKAEHSFGDWVVDQAATCAAEGSRSRACKTCGKKETETVERLPHTFGDWTTLVALTRNADGERGHTCAVCGLEERETVKAEPGFARKDRGEGVRAVQKMLNDLGYDAGKADGVYGPKLDRAFEAFAREKGVSFAEGWLMPAQLDALASGWIQSLPEEEWMGAREGLTLTVEPVGDADGARSFNWTLSASGKESCTLRAVLMGIGGDHDFTRGDDLAVVMGSEKFKPGAKNALSGTFTIPEGTGSGQMLSFAAVVETGKKADKKWISNTVNCVAIE